MGASLPKGARLRSPEAFRSLLASREKISSPYFSIKYKRRDLTDVRLGIVLPKKKFPVRSNAID